VIPSLIELTLRALLVAAVVWAGLRLFRVRDVLAQKAAWGLVLAAAILMPFVLPLALRWRIVPAGMGVVLPANLLQRANQAAAHAAATQPLQRLLAAPAEKWTPAAVLPSRSTAAKAAERTQPMRVSPHVEASSAPVLRSTMETPPPMDRWRTAVKPGLALPDLEWLAVAVYFAVAAVLMLRIVFGLVSTVSLWLDAEPVELGRRLQPAHEGLRLRSTRAISSPVTVGSGIVLPADYDEWDIEKLRIVLAHERSHVRQGDFYLQLFAGVYAALFWFSPLGWWLKSKLSDLGEAISDRAGLEEARSRSSYAQVLLEFAALPRPTLIGVAMARSSSLSHRIDRLLNDTAFRQAFAVSRRRALVAAMLVPIAFVAATAFIRVEAASQAAPPAAAAPAVAPAPAVAAEAPIAGTSNPGEVLEPVAAIAPSEPVAPVAPPAAIDPLAPVSGGLTVIPALAPRAPQAPLAPQEDDHITVGRGESLTIARSEQDRNSDRRHIRSYSGSGDGYSYSFSSDGEAYALVTDPSKGIRFSGDWFDGRREEIEKASRMAHGPYLWFTYEGKSYVVDDAAIIHQIEAMYKPIEELGRQQEDLGKQQEELGRQQEELGRKQEQATVPAADVSREIARIEASLAKLKAKQGANVTQEELGDLQSEMGDLQGRLGDLQGKVGEEQGRLGAMQGKLGEQQGKLGEQQGRLGEEQGRLSREADRKVKSIISESLANGKARQVQ